MRQRFPSAAAFEAALARSGIDEKHLRETLRQDLRMRAYLDQRFSTATERRAALINEWMAGLRRRGDVIDLYLSGTEMTAAAGPPLLSPRNGTICSRSKPAWLTIGAMHDRRRR